MQPRLLRLCVAALAVTGFLTPSSRASADTIDTLKLTYNGGGNGQNYGGPFNWTQTTPINTNFNTALTSYCIDINDAVRTGTFTTHTDLTKAPTIGNDAAKLAAITTLFDHFYCSSLANATSEAAFQLALWELVYDGASPNLSTGTITADGAAKTAAQGLLSGSSYNGTEHDLANAHLVALVSSDYGKPRNQDQLTVVPNGVPAPPAVMLAGIGVLALLGRSRWTRRTTAAA